MGYFNIYDRLKLFYEKDKKRAKAALLGCFSVGNLLNIVN